MTTVTVTLSSQLEEFVNEQVAQGKHASAGAFIESVLKDARKRAARQKLERLALEGLATPAAEMSEKDWEKLRRIATEGGPKRVNAERKPK